MAGNNVRLALEGLGAIVGPTDGAARYLCGLALGLSQQPQLDLLVLHGPSMRGAVHVRGDATCRTVGGSKRPSRVAAQHLTIPKMASRWDAHAVVYTGNYCPVLVGPPPIVVVQNMLLVKGTFDYGYAVGLYRRWQLTRIARHAACIVAISPFLAEAFLEEFPNTSAKLVVIPPGIDERFFAKDADEGSTGRWRTRPYFLCVGTAWRYRDYELALSALAQSQLDHDLVIVGTAEPRDCERLRRHAMRCGIRGELIMAGTVDTHEMQTAYHDATALVATSRIESFALSVLEAMAVGTPVVAVRRTVYPETVGHAGLLCDPTVMSLAEGLLTMTDPGVRKEFVSKGRDRARNARWSNAASEIGAIARELGS